MSALQTPPRLAPDTLRIIPLGGLGDIGRNMTVFEINGKLLVVDCGVLFPEDDQPGVDLILPGLDYLDDRLDDIVGLVLTHGHEDHIGAVPYLLRRRQDIPLYGSKLTLAFVDGKLREHRLRDTAMYHQVVEGDTVVAGPVRAGVLRGQPSRMRWPSRSRPAPAWCCIPATSRWISCRSTSGSLTCAGSRAAVQ